MGYYVGDLFDSVLINEASNDFWEMIMHHMLTITLFGGMIMQNQMRVGVIVAFIHNFTDIFTSISRCSSQTVRSDFSCVLFLSCTALWIYFRNFALPVITYACWTMASYSEPLASYYKLHYFLSGFLTMLCVMHVYWTFMFFKIILNYVETGKTDDIQRKFESSKQNSPPKQVELTN